MPCVPSSHTPSENITPALGNTQLATFAVLEILKASLAKVSPSLAVSLASKPNHLPKPTAFDNLCPNLKFAPNISPNCAMLETSKIGKFAIKTVLEASIALS